MEEGGATLVYATDHEPHAPALWRPDRAAGRYDPEAMLHPADARHAEFLRDADLVIHDSQYTAAEYPAKVGWGHSTAEYAVDVSLAARARQLALFHYDPTRTDEGVDGLLAACPAPRRGQRSTAGSPGRGRRHGANLGARRDVVLA